MEDWNAVILRLALPGRGLFFAAVKERFFKYWLVVVVWMCLVFCASTKLGRPDNSSRILRPLLHWLYPHLSEATFEQIHFLARKTLHFLEYAVLGLLVWRLIYYEPALAECRPRIYLTALLIAALYASSDEFHQSFVPGREAAVHDVALDTFGAGMGLLALWTARRIRQRA